MIKTHSGRKLGVTSAHRRALLRNMTQSLLMHEKVVTTLAKAKELRPFAEKIITHAIKGKHVLVRRHIHDKIAYQKLFAVLAPRYSQKHGGYTRVLHLAPRSGDNAKRGVIELIP